VANDYNLAAAITKMIRDPSITKSNPFNRRSKVSNAQRNAFNKWAKDQPVFKEGPRFQTRTAGFIVDKRLEYTAIFFNNITLRAFDPKTTNRGVRFGILGLAIFIAVIATDDDD
jgi:hypothetical protein